MHDKLLTNETHEPSLVRIHARDICAMLKPRFLAISSTLVGFEEVHRLDGKVKGVPLDYFLIAGLFKVRVVKAIPAA